MDRTTMMATRKQRLATPEQTACTLSAADAQEAPSFTFLLQAVLSEVQQKGTTARAAGTCGGVASASQQC